MECNQCGKKLREGLPTCPRCGAEQVVQPALVNLSELNEQEIARHAKKKPLTRKQLIIRVTIIATAIIAALAIAIISIPYLLIASNIQQESELSGDLGIEYVLPEGVVNIALFGLDTRQNNDGGRSDAMIILSIDQIHNQIKLTSLGRDTLVAIDGYGKSKLTHAWAFGKRTGRAALAVKTINQNFGMNIEDYVYVNFFEFAEIIDYIGGVEIDVSASEMRVMNRTYAPFLRAAGINCPDVTQEGMQLLCGGQALAYARNRYTGSDIDRGDRQKEVLEAMFTAVKDTSFTKYPALISKILGMCHTSLTSSEMMGLAAWAATNQPTFSKFSLPCPEVNAWGGTTSSYGWVWIYDMDVATALLHDFIYEEQTDLSTLVTSGLDPAATEHLTTTATSATTETTDTETTDTETTEADGTTTSDTTATTHMDDGATTDDTTTTTMTETSTTRRRRTTTRRTTRRTTTTTTSRYKKTTTKVASSAIVTTTTSTTTAATTTVTTLPVVSTTETTMNTTVVTEATTIATTAPTTAAVVTQPTDTPVTDADIPADTTTAPVITDDTTDADVVTIPTTPTTEVVDNPLKPET